MFMKIKILIIISFTIIFNFAYSQNEGNDKLDNQTLIIYNEYSPVVKDANRIQFLPVVIDTVKVIPKFEYSVRPPMYKTDYTPTPINVASIKGESLKPLNNGLVKIGLGNYLTPYLEGFYNTTRNMDYSAGVHVKHHSSHGKTKNSEDQKIYNGYANSMIKAFGKKFMYASTLSADLGFSSNIINYYGYDPVFAKYVNTIPPRDRSEMEDINFMRFNSNIALKSNNINKYKFNYDLDLGYQYFFTSEKDKQHNVKFVADFNKAFDVHRFGLDTKVDFNNIEIKSFSQYNKTYLDLNPYYKLYSDNWQIRLGLNTTGEFIKSNTKYHFYPNVYVQHNISNTLIPYASFKGYIENNDLESLSKTNPFINRINIYESTNHSQVLDFGVKGNISSNIYFHINANYSKIDNMALCYNDTSLVFENKFQIIYTDVERFSGYGEVALRDFNNFSFTLKGHYYYYHYVKNEDKAWHMPNFDICLKTNYQFNEKLNFGVDIDFIGKRYAKVYNRIIETPEWQSKKLNAIFDVSLFGEYRLSSNFSCFLYLNNITGQKQYYWNNYQSQRFNILVGLKYIF